jgi:hypothetical protein
VIGRCRVGERRFTHGGKDYVVRSGLDGAVWKTSVYEEGGEESLYDFGVSVGTLRAAGKGHPIADHVHSDALAEQCEKDYKRFVDGWPKMVAEFARRASADKTS